MARTASKVKDMPKTSKTSKEQINDSTTMPSSPNTSSSSSASTSSLSSSTSIDFLSNPKAMPSSDVENEHNSTIGEPIRESVIYEDEEDEIVPVQLPQSSKNKTKQIKSRAKPKPKENRKQEKPVKRKDRVIREIHRLRDTTDLLIPKAPFQRYQFHI